MKSVRRFGLLATLCAASFASIAETKTVTLEVKSMVCSMCSAAVSKALLKVPGVEAAKVDLAAKRAVVTFDAAKTSPEALTKATAAAGFSSMVSP